MYKINDVVTYGSAGVCKIVDISKQKIGARELEYYVLKPSFQTSALIYVPIDNKELVNKMKPALSAGQMQELIRSMSEIDDTWTENDAERAGKFRAILHSGDRQQLIKLIKSVYVRGKKLSDSGKRLKRIDEDFMREAEKLLYNEIAVVLNIHPDQVLTMIINEIESSKAK